MRMFKFFRISWFLVVSIILCGLLVFRVGASFLKCGFSILTSLFLFDSLSFYFLLLVIFLGVYTKFIFYKNFTSTVRVFLSISLVFRCVRFFLNHAILFWCCYELSMLPLLYLIFLESPYSERFLAGWYFSCYLIITRLPLVLILLYIGLIENRFLFSEWSLSLDFVSILVVLAFIFFTKVPLFPFHTWLPIVHAEATSIVSIYLRGYIMKLGLLGVYRCCKCIFNSRFILYLFLALVVRVIFLIISSGELDGKRWLAFLRLSHIVIPFFGFFISDWSIINYSFFYCLGHGLSAGILFGLLWCFYDICGSRNWLLLKSSVSGGFIMYIVVFRFLSLCSFPTTIQFFCEVGFIWSSCYSFIYIVFWLCYLFCGGLIPLVLAGHLLIRCEYIDSDLCRYFKFLNLLIFLLLWCYVGFIVL